MACSDTPTHSPRLKHLEPVALQASSVTPGSSGINLCLGACFRHDWPCSFASDSVACAGQDHYRRSLSGTLFRFGSRMGSMSFGKKLSKSLSFYKDSAEPHTCGDFHNRQVTSHDLQPDFLCVFLSVDEHNLSVVDWFRQRSWNNYRTIRKRLNLGG